MEGDMHLFAGACAFPRIHLEGFPSQMQLDSQKDTSAGSLWAGHFQ